MTILVPATDKAFDRETKVSLADFPEADLTPEEHSKWIEARTALLWAARFFAIVFYDKASVRFVRDERCPTLMTDDRVIIVNIGYFMKLTVGERVFALCHEVAHMIYAHCQLGWEARKRGYLQVNSGATQLFPDVPPGCLPFSPQLMNIAQDFMINAALIESKVGQFNKSWLHNPKYTGLMASVDIYADIFKQQPPQVQKELGQQSKDGSGDGDQQTRMPSGTEGTERFDGHLDPGSGGGKDPEQAASERTQTDAEWKMTVQKAAQVARMAGQMPASLERLVNDIIRPQVDWREKIVGFMARSLGGGGYDWKRADRDWITRQPKRIFMPARSGNGCGTVVVVGDTSGSITGEEMKMIVGCVVGILEDARPQRVILLWCDAAVHFDGEYDEPGDLLARNAPKGGGGTDFRPPFQWCAENDVVPDTLVYVTDMYGAFPQEAPNYPVIWASISKVLEAPFGEVVEVPR